MSMSQEQPASHPRGVRRQLPRWLKIAILCLIIAGNLIVLDLAAVESAGGQLTTTHGLITLAGVICEGLIFYWRQDELRRL